MICYSVVFSNYRHFLEFDYSIAQISGAKTVQRITIFTINIPQNPVAF